MDEGVTSELKIEATRSRDLLERLVREGARNALQAALEEEVTLFLQRFAGFRDERGHRRAVRNGYMPERTILSGITKKTKGCGSRVATLTMVFKLALEAQKTWRRLMGHEQIALVMARKKCINGEFEVAA